jgi:hypothetical protein
MRATCPKSHIHFPVFSLCQEIHPISRLCEMVRNDFFRVGVVSPLPDPPSWRTTHFRLSATAYSIYSQLTFLPEGLLLYPQPEDAPCSGDIIIIIIIIISAGLITLCWKYRPTQGAFSSFIWAVLWESYFNYVIPTIFCRVSSKSLNTNLAWLSTCCPTRALRVRQPEGTSNPSLSSGVAIRMRAGQKDVLYTVSCYGD